jgi:hypothetical protein
MIRSDSASLLDSDSDTDACYSAQSLRSHYAFHPNMTLRKSPCFDKYKIIRNVLLSCEHGKKFTDEGYDYQLLKMGSQRSWLHRIVHEIDPVPVATQKFVLPC